MYQSLGKQSHVLWLKLKFSRLAFLKNYQHPTVHVKQFNIFTLNKWVIIPVWSSENFRKIICRTRSFTQEPFFPVLRLKEHKSVGLLDILLAWTTCTVHVLLYMGKKLVNFTHGNVLTKTLLSKYVPVQLKTSVVKKTHKLDLQQWNRLNFCQTKTVTQEKEARFIQFFFKAWPIQHFFIFTFPAAGAHYTVKADLHNNRLYLRQLKH